MPKQLFFNIKSLVGVEQHARPRVMGHDMKKLPTLNHAWLFVEDGLIADFGTGEAPASLRQDPATELIDATGRFVLPAFCDSHTHIVFAGSREKEFMDKINGLTYEEVAKRGGGILNSADRLGEATEDELYVSAKARVEEVMAMGTGALEIKTGYGLTLENELKMLRVIKRLQDAMPITIKATFLGAHALPRSFKGRGDDYVEMVCSEWLPKVKAQGIAEFFDVFCEEGFFEAEQTAKMCQKAVELGFRPKLHANQLHVSGGVQVGIKYNALSVDHLENAEAAEIKALAESTTIPTVLPGCSFFSNLPMAQAKAMIEANLPLCLASDYNPGSTPSGSMPFLWSLACIKMRLTPEEAFNALTLNGAAALGLQATHGSICRGKKANLILTQPLSSLAWIPYAYQSPFIARTFFSK